MDIRYHELLLIIKHQKVRVNRCSLCQNCRSPYDAGNCDFAKDGLCVDDCADFLELSNDSTDFRLEEIAMIQSDNEDVPECDEEVESACNQD